MSEIPIWTPDPKRIQGTNLHRFMAFTENRNGLNFSAYADLHRWSIEHPELFWRNLEISHKFARRLGGEQLKQVAIPCPTPNGSQMPD